MIELDMMEIIRKYSQPQGQVTQTTQVAQVPQNSGEYTPLTREKLANALGYTPLTRNTLGQTLNGGGALANLFSRANAANNQANQITPEMMEMMIKANGRDLRSYSHWGR